MRFGGQLKLMAAAAAADIFLAGWLAAEIAGWQPSAGAAPAGGGIAAPGPVSAMGAENGEDEMDAENGADAGSGENEEDGVHYLALTFDDGPRRGTTEKLLDGLKRRDVKATFFLVGENVAGNEDLVERMDREGHLIGVHCYSHQDMTRIETGEAAAQMERTAAVIEKITGKRPSYFRPPYGKGANELAEQLGMTPVLWDVDPEDWRVQDSGRVASHIIGQAPDHQVVLLHDVFSASVEAALKVIDRLSDKGYVFVTADEMEID